MNNAKPVLWRTMKAIMWVALIIVSLFLVVAVLIQIPAIQTKIVRYATTLVSDKTHTKVELKKVSISFPKSIVIEELYLEDTQNDTLIYTSKAKANIDLFDLLIKKITISSFTLTNATVNLYSTKTDPSFNYAFLTTAFSDTTNQLNTDTLSTSKWVFNLGKVYLQNLRFTYNDDYAGMNVYVAIGNSELKVDKIDFNKSIYAIDELFLEGLTTYIRQVATTNIQNKNADSVMPVLSAKKLEINNAVVSYIDSVGCLSVFTDIDRGELKNALVDLQKELLTTDDIFLAKSEIRYHDFKPAITSDSIPVNSSSENNWTVAVNNLRFDDNSFSYKVGDTPALKDEFDSDNLDFNQMNLTASDFYYSSELTKVSVQKFNAVNQDNFVINSLATDFSMDEHSITTSKLKLKTPYSTIDADFYLQYTSLDRFTNNYQFSDLKLNMRNVSFRNPDARYFNQALSQQPFFKNDTILTTITGKINGPINHLVGQNLVVKTGQNTLLETDFSISGLPEMKTALFNFPNLSIRTGKNDLFLMAGPSIPENIALPENISLQAAFNGTMNAFESAVKLTSSFGDANLTAIVDSIENFNGKVSLNHLDLGQLLKDTLFYGPVSLKAEAKGHGLKMEILTAKIKAEATQLYLNQYNYQNLTLDGTVAGKQFEGKINLNDENAVFGFNGLVNLNPGKEQYKFRLNMLGADLQKLHLVGKDVRMSFDAEADFRGNGLNNLNGTGGVNNIIIASGEKIYRLESFLSASVNEPKRSEFNVNSALIGIKYAGTISPAALPAVLKQFINNYFPVADSLPASTKSEHSNFNFEIQLHNHPILSEVLFPGLNEFIPGTITGSFDSEKNDLKLNATVKKIIYGTTEFRDLAIAVASDNTSLNYKISMGEIANQQFGLNNLIIDGKVADNKITTSFASIDDDQNKKLMIHAQLTKEAANYKLSLNPTEFYLMNKRWDLASDNYIEFGKQGFLIHHLTLKNAESQLAVASVNDRFNDDLQLSIQNFKLQDITGIVSKDSALVKGTIDGNVLLKRVNESYGTVADASVTNIFLRNIPIGNLKAHAEDAGLEKFNFDVLLSGEGNQLTAKGHYLPNGGANTISIKSAIESLSMKTIEAFSMGQISEASGTLSGEFVVVGSTEMPEITGEMVFKNAFLNPKFLNHRIELKHEVVQLKDDGIYFNNFSLFDDKQNTAILNGAVKMQHFSNFEFTLNVSSRDFLLFNTTAKDNEAFFGQMIIDSKIDVSGSMLLPVVKAQLKMKKGSNFTFVVPEDQLTTDKGEDVVEFETGPKLNPILSRNGKTAAHKSSLSGFDVAAIIEIDKEATLRLLMDPTSADSLVVKGEAALSFSMDQSGTMSLTGAYNLSEGSYLVTLESVIKKQFDINAGSTILWNGDPLDATISINAQYQLRTSPYDLVAGQLSGLSSVDQNQYKQRYPFIVLLKLRGKILQPEISFEIQLPPDQKGILGGSVNQRLSLLNEDPSALNKQVFALLVLGRFVQENPFQAETSGSASTLIRSTVSKFLSAQLNQLSSKLIPGVELNFDIQSYDDYQSGQAQGRTQVEVGMKKQLFNERLSVQIGGTVDVEGDKAKQNSASDITSDVTVEYKLNKDGSFRLKGFRHNQYEGAIEGQLVETGAGVVYVKDFNRWCRKPPKSTQEGL